MKFLFTFHRGLINGLTNDQLVSATLPHFSSTFTHMASGVWTRCSALCSKMTLRQVIAPLPCVTEKPNMAPGVLPVVCTYEACWGICDCSCFCKACHCLYLCLQNTKWAVAGNEPLHFLTTASQTDVSVVLSQMFPRTAILLELVFTSIRDEQDKLTWMMSVPLVDDCVPCCDWK